MELTTDLSLCFVSSSSNWTRWAHSRATNDIAAGGTAFAPNALWSPNGNGLWPPRWVLLLVLISVTSRQVLNLDGYLLFLFLFPIHRSLYVGNKRRKSVRLASWDSSTPQRFTIILVILDLAAEADEFPIQTIRLRQEGESLMAYRRQQVILIRPIISRVQVLVSAQKYLWLKRENIFHKWIIIGYRINLVKCGTILIWPTMPSGGTVYLIIRIQEQETLYLSDKDSVPYEHTFLTFLTSSVSTGLCIELY